MRNDRAVCQYRNSQLKIDSNTIDSDLRFRQCAFNSVSFPSLPMGESWCCNSDMLRSLFFSAMRRKKKQKWSPSLSLPIEIVKSPQV